MTCFQGPMNDNSVIPGPVLYRTLRLRGLSPHPWYRPNNVRMPLTFLAQTRIPVAPLCQRVSSNSISIIASRPLMLPVTNTGDWVQLTPSNVLA